jgi:hypothetical protein
MGAGPRDLWGEEDCTDPPICPGDDEIGAGGCGEGANEDGDEEEGEDGAAERRRRSRHLPAARSRRGVWLRGQIEDEVLKTLGRVFACLAKRRRR